MTLERESLIIYPTPGIQQRVKLWRDERQFGEREAMTDLADQSVRAVMHLLKENYPNPNIRQIAGYIDGVFGVWEQPVVGPLDAFSDTTVIGFKGVHETGIPGQRVHWVASMGHKDIEKVMVNVGIEQDYHLVLAIYSTCIHPAAYNTLNDILRANSDDTMSIRFMQKNGRLTIIENWSDMVHLEMSKIGEVMLSVRGVFATYDCFADHHVVGQSDSGTSDATSAADESGRVRAPGFGAA